MFTHCYNFSIKILSNLSFSHIPVGIFLTLPWTSHTGKLFFSFDCTRDRKPLKEYHLPALAHLWQGAQKEREKERERGRALVTGTRCTLQHAPKVQISSTLCVSVCMFDRERESSSRIYAKFQNTIPIGYEKGGLFRKE